MLNIQLKILKSRCQRHFEMNLKKDCLLPTGSGRSTGNSHKNLFGDSPVQQQQSAKNRLPSNIPIGSSDAPDSNGNLRENGYGSEKSN